MKKGLTEMVFILDRSGSMSGLEADTIGGYNAMLKKQKAEEGEAYISTILFDDTTDVIADRVPVEKAEMLTDREYFVKGSTALLDAVGKAVHHIGNIHKYAREEDRPEKTIFVITTDGQENASREYDYKKVRQMVKRQQERYGWEFLFLGANLDAVKEAVRFGIREDRAADYACDAIGTKLLYHELSETICNFRQQKPTASISAEWKKKIEEDCNSRTRK